jgi:hypothetical protein
MGMLRGRNFSSRDVVAALQESIRRPTSEIERIVSMSAVVCEEVVKVVDGKKSSLSFWPL